MSPIEQAQELSLYRRWRPRTFAQVIGQDLVVGTLKRAVAQGRSAHAYLFCGQRGVGKTSVARILARAVNCLDPLDGEPCNACESCTRILEGKALDVVEIDGASNRGIDQIRQLREQVGYVPAGARYKVYIIDEVHMLTGEAFNALLKTLEEPPPRVLFILATTEPHKIPSTVLSRCQAFEFAPVAQEMIARKLAEIATDEGIELEERAAALIAARSGGAMRDAEVLLEQMGRGAPVTEQTVLDILGLPPSETLDAFVTALAAGDAQTPLSVVAELTARGRDLGMFLEEAAVRARDRIIEGAAQLIPVARALVRWRAELPRTLSRRLHVELGILELCGPQTPSAADKPQGAATSRPQKPAKPSSTDEAAQPTEVKTHKPSAKEAPAEEKQAPSPRKTRQAATQETPTKEEENPEWQRMLAECYGERRSLAVFLAPAKAALADGTLRIVLPAEFRFHYECLQEPDVRQLMEQIAQRCFGALLAVHVEWEGREVSEPSLEERAALAAEVLEGEIVKEQTG